MAAEARLLYSLPPPCLSAFAIPTSSTYPPLTSTWSLQAASGEGLEPSASASVRPSSECDDGRARCGRTTGLWGGGGFLRPSRAPPFAASPSASVRRPTERAPRNHGRRREAFLPCPTAAPIAAMKGRTKKHRKRIYFENTIGFQIDRIVFQNFCSSIKS